MNSSHSKLLKTTKRHVLFSEHANVYYLNNTAIALASNVLDSADEKPE